MTTDQTLRAALEELAGQPSPPQYDEKGHYIGRVGGTEHHTAGGRAWCLNCGGWCYPESYACPCCEPKVESSDIRELLATHPATEAATAADVIERLAEDPDALAAAYGGRYGATQTGFLRNLAKHLREAGRDGESD